MTIVQVNGGGNTPNGDVNGEDLLIGGQTDFEQLVTGFTGALRVASGDVNGDAFDFSQLTTETAPEAHIEPYLEVKLTNTLISGYGPDASFQIISAGTTTEPTAPANERSGPSVSEIVVTKVTDSTSPLSEDNLSECVITKLADGETTDFQPELTTEPTAPEAYKFQTVFTTKIALVDASSDVTGHTPEWTNFRSSDPGTPDDGFFDVLIDDLDPPDPRPAHVQTDDGLLLPAVQIASGDVNGDNSTLPSVHHVAISLGDGTTIEARHVGLPEVPGDDFIIIDYKPTESLAVDLTNPDVGSSGHTGGANFVFCDGAVRSDEGPQFTTEPTAPEAGKVYSKPLTFTATVTVPDADGHDVGDDLAVDPNNPNADLLATPGPDDDLELPAVQKVGAFRDGLSLPDLSLPAVQDDGLLTTEPTAPEGTIVITSAVALGSPEEDVALGSPEEDVAFYYGRMLPADVESAGMYIGMPIYGNPNIPDGGHDDVDETVTYDSVEVLGQPTVAMETLITAHEGFLI